MDRLFALIAELRTALPEATPLQEADCGCGGHSKADCECDEEETVAAEADETDDDAAEEEDGDGDAAEEGFGFGSRAPISLFPGRKTVPGPKQISVAIAKKAAPKVHADRAAKLMAKYQSRAKNNQGEAEEDEDAVEETGPVDPGPGKPIQFGKVSRKKPPTIVRKPAPLPPPRPAANIVIADDVEEMDENDFCLEDWYAIEALSREQDEDLAGAMVKPLIKKLANKGAKNARALAAWVGRKSAGK